MLKIALLLSVTLSFVLACASFAPALDRSADKIAEGVNKYCAETDEAFRSQLRAQVNSKTDGATIVVTCPE